MELIKEIAKPVQELKRKHDQKQAYKKIKKGLMQNPALLDKQKIKFEKAFGKDQQSRTRKQWARLVNTYGMATVCKSENMTEDEVILKINESFSQKFRRIAK